MEGGRGKEKAYKGQDDDGLEACRHGWIEAGRSGREGLGSRGADKGSWVGYCVMQWRWRMRAARIRCALMTLEVWKGVFAVADVAEGWAVDRIGLVPSSQQGSSEWSCPDCIGVLSIKSDQITRYQIR